MTPSTNIPYGAKPTTDDDANVTAVVFHVPFEQILGSLYERAKKRKRKNLLVYEFNLYILQEFDLRLIFLTLGSRALATYIFP